MLSSRRSLLATIGTTITGGLWVSQDSVAQYLNNDRVNETIEQVPDAPEGNATDLVGTATKGPPSVSVKSDGVHRQDSWLGLNQSGVEAAIHGAINDVRRPIKLDKHLSRIARYHSWHMAVNDYYAHTSPDGADHSDRYRRFGFQCDGTTWENIHRTYAFTDIVGPDGDTIRYDNETELGKGIVEEWLNSPDHRSGIMDYDWDAEGVGVWWVADDEYGGVRVYATQNFC